MRKAEQEEFMVEVMELLERLNCPAYLWNDVVFIASTYLLELITLKKTLLLLPPFNYSPVLKYLRSYSLEHYFCYSGGISRKRWVCHDCEAGHIEDSR